MYKFIVLWKVL